MKNLICMNILALAFAISFAEAAGPTPIIGPSANLGGVTFSDGNLNIPASNPGQSSGNWFTLYGSVGAGGAVITAGRFEPFYKNGVAYQAHATKKTYCMINAVSTAAGAYFQLVSSTAAIAVDTATALTNGKYQCGGAASYCIGPTTTTMQTFGMFYVFDALTYPAYQANSSDVHVHLNCIEI